MKIKRVFIASPLFSVGERQLCRLLVDIVENELKLEAYWAWSSADEEIIGKYIKDVPIEEGWQIRLREKLREEGREEEADMIIFMSDKSLLERADIVIAVLDGPDVDSGTAWEIGYAYARGKPIIGVRTDTRTFMGSTSVNIMVKSCIEERGKEFFIQLDGKEGDIADLRRTLKDKISALIKKLEEG